MKHLSTLEELAKEFNDLNTPAKRLGHVDVGISVLSYIELQSRRTVYVQALESIRDIMIELPGQEDTVEKANVVIELLRVRWDPLLDFPKEKKNPNRKLKVGDVF